MEDHVTSAACDRIEAALARIAAALAGAASARPRADEDLARRHELLREAAASALLAIDALVAEAEETAP